MRLELTHGPAGPGVLADGRALPVPPHASPTEVGLAAARRHAARSGRELRVEVVDGASVTLVTVGRHGAVTLLEPPATDPVAVVPAIPPSAPAPEEPMTAVDRPAVFAPPEAVRTTPPLTMSPTASATSAWASPAPASRPRRPVSSLVVASLVAVAVLVGAVGTGVATMSSSQALPDSCRPVTLYAVGGQGGSSDVLRGVTDPLAKQFGEKVSVVTVPPPPDGGSFASAESDAVGSLANAMGRHVDDCPSGSLMLFGYSQGAQVAGDLASRVGTGLEPRIPATLVQAVGLFGDPARSPRTRAVPDGTTGQGALPPRAVGFGSLDARTIEICAPGDPVCDSPPTAAAPPLEKAVASPVHGSYQQLPVAAGTTAPQWAAASLGKVVAAIPTDAGPATTAPGTAPQSGSGGTGDAGAATTTPPASGTGAETDGSYEGGGSATEGGSSAITPTTTPGGSSAAGGSGGAAASTRRSGSASSSGGSSYPSGSTSGAGATGSSETGSAGPGSGGTASTSDSTADTGATGTSRTGSADTTGTTDTGSSGAGSSDPGSAGEYGAGSGASGTGTRSGSTATTSSTPSTTSSAPSSRRSSGSASGDPTTTTSATPSRKRGSGGEKTDGEKTGSKSGGQKTGGQKTDGQKTDAAWSLAGGLEGFKSTPWNNQGATDPSSAPSPNVPGRKAVKFEMPGGGKRTEAEPDVPEFTEGQRAFVGYSGFFDQGFPTNTDTWQLIMQFKQPGTGSPPLAVEVGKGQLRLANDGGSEKDFCPVTQGAFSFQLGVTFGGAIDAWCNGKQTLTGYTTPKPNVQGSAYLKTGIYRDESIKQDSTLFVNDLKVGKTLDSVSGLAGAGTGSTAATTGPSAGGTSDQASGADSSAPPTAAPTSTAPASAAPASADGSAADALGAVGEGSTGAASGTGSAAYFSAGPGGPPPPGPHPPRRADGS